MKKDWGAVIISPDCSNHCLFCGRAESCSISSLRKQEEAVLKNIREFRKSGIQKIEISGSDPIEYDKISNLIGFLKRHFKTVQLSTHGRNLQNEDFAKDIISSGLDRLKIPIYGSTAKIHDSVTRSKGSFNETIRGIINIRKLFPKMYILANTLIMKNNLNDIINMVRLVKRLRIDRFHLSVPFISNGDYSYYVPFKDLTGILPNLFQEIEGLKCDIRFLDIPFCVFGRVSNIIDNQGGPPNLGDSCQPPQRFSTEIKDTPSYRLKKKTDICQNCICDSFCDGFLVNDIQKYGTGAIKGIYK